MSRPEKKTGSGAYAAAGLFRVAIVGAGTLKGKELAELIPETSFPAVDIKLLDDDETLGQLESVGDEMTFVQSVRRENFDGIDFAFFASEEKFTQRNWKMAKEAGTVVVDLSYALEEEPGARVRSPWVEHETGAAPAPELEPAPVVVANPAAIALALLLLRAQKAAPLRTAAVTIFEPASEHGRRGMDELHEQTVNLLSFHDLPKEVFDAQVAFNLLASYGENSQPALKASERRIVDHLKKIAPTALVPATILIQAPIFHGHAFSLYLETETRCSLGDFAQALAGEHVAISRVAEEEPSNVSAAGQGEVLVSVRHDGTRENGFWIWGASDNLRVLALNAVECAQAMAAARPKGSLQ